ncbi:MAG: leucine-rich repeat domain-containing protein [Mycoplasmoidaceae bacterium]|nr:leucine-rich repeat domain-containing protein [Mycoplasmoidaceae bacterium]
MRKHYRHLLCPLMAVAVTTLSCCALANGVLATQKVTPTETDVPIPVDYFKFNESGDTLLGFADGVTMEDIFLQDFNGIDLSKEAMGQREIKKIAPYAFANVFTYGCPIKTLVLPESVEEIGQGAFYFCPGFTNHLYIPSKLKNIGQDAFFYAGFTGDLVIPDSVISIGAQAFWHIDTLSGTLKIPASVQEIGYRAFKGLVNIEGLDLSEYESIPT